MISERRLTRHKGAGKPEERVQKEALYPFFSFNRKLRSLLNKNAPRDAHSRNSLFFPALIAKGERRAYNKKNEKKRSKVR